MRRTLKPCPGCGAKNTARHADKVCDNCSHAIGEWNKHVARTNAETDLSTVELKGAYHWYPMFYFGGPQSQVEGFDETRTTLGRLFAEIGELSCVEKFEWQDIPRRKDEDAPEEYLFFRPVVRYPKAKNEHYARPADYPANEGNSSFRNLYGKIDSRILKVIRLLWDHAARFAEMAYLGGVQDGRNLLFQIASGQLSPQELQKRDISLAKDVQNSGFLHRKLSAKRKPLRSGISV